MYPGLLGKANQAEEHVLHYSRGKNSKITFSIFSFKLTFDLKSKVCTLKEGNDFIISTVRSLCLLIHFF